MTENDTGGFPRRCGPSTELRLVGVAIRVRDDLRRVGIPAVYAGSSFDGLSQGISGAAVFHTPRDDESCGVYVKWMSSPELLARITRREGPDPQAIALGAAAAESMLAALRSILSAAGWEVSDYLNSVSGELYLRVGGPFPRSDSSDIAAPAE